ncbi:MAG: phenylalanine--tRNA ligase subunit beta, partial [Candidatus Hydrogenedentales bacterium]
MLVSLNWLREYVALEDSVDALCDRMTMLGLEIEGVQRLGAGVQGVVIGQIQSIEPHPDADKLVVCKTDVGAGEPLQIVCGAKNMKVGDRVPTAVVGATLPGDFKITRRKMRGIESQGMMCSPRELGLGDEHDGLLILGGDAPIGADAKQVLGLNDAVLEIEVIPNRGDWASMLGIARELAAASGKLHCKPEATPKETGPKTADLSSVSIERPDLCPRYVGRVIRGAKVGPSPEWLKKRLIAAGQRPINNVVDITNYVLLETGHPLHAFDLQKLKGQRVIIRTAKPGEKIKTIDQEVRELTPEMLVIADAEAPVAVAGVMGGYDSEVGEDTVDLFIESAYFEPVQVRRTSRALTLITEASQRFQRGADPEMPLYAANRACQLILEIAGGELAAGALDEYPEKVTRPSITLRYEETDKLLGVNVPPLEQQRYLTALGFKVLEVQNGTARYQTPSWRYDCALEADLIEEVARLYGYERIPTTVPRVPRTEVELAPEHKVMRRLRHLLVDLGLTEAINWSFGAADEDVKAGLARDNKAMVMLQNPLSENYAGMRTSLIPGLLRTASLNLRKSRPRLALFELGPVYTAGDAADALPEQANRLGIVMSGPARPNHWSQADRETDFYDLKGVVEELLAYLRVEATYKAGDSKTFQTGQAADVYVGEKRAGSLGAVAFDVRSAFDLDQAVFVAELDLDVLLGQPAVSPLFAEISAFPPSLRD